MAISSTTHLTDTATWNERIAALGGPMQLTSEWVEFVCRKDRVTPLFLTGDGRSSFEAAVIYLSTPSRWPLSRWPSASSECMPLAADRGKALAELERHLDAMGCRDLALHSFGDPKSAPGLLTSLGYRESRRMEFILDLAQAPEAAWVGFRPTLRNDIRRFQRSGTLCRMEQTRDIIPSLFHIEQQTSERHRQQGKAGKAMADAVFHLMWEQLLKTNRARAYLAEFEGRAMAFVVVGTCGEKAYYLYGGATPEGLKAGAPKGLLWHAIQEEYLHGVREFNLGGMSEEAANSASLDHGLYKFKTGFGATERLCLSGIKVLRPIVTWAHNRLRSLSG